MRNWIWYVLVILNIEKIIQHIFVTFAFWQNIGGIRSQVAVPPDLLLIAGAGIAFLFILSLWGLLSSKPWAINLLIGLALFDIVGEFIAQGRIDIALPVSFVVAVVILILAYVYRRQNHKTKSSRG
jgi:energy-converting hydrogenase Eha subunit C